MQILIFLAILLIILYIGTFFKIYNTSYRKENYENKNNKKNTVNPCTDFLSDKDYLVHMIPHHQVAIDMCNLMIPISKSKTIQNIYRTIVFNQNIEILFMKQVLNDIPKLSGEINTSFRDTEFDTSLSIDNKSTPENYYCDPLFFKPDDHSEHMHHMKHTDKSFLEHMIPHHQVAVVMSNRLLKYTNNTHMIRICYEIITAQRYEILKMNYLLDEMKQKNLEFLPDYY
jgi:uncharacterized protein (DUF305 family)